MSQSCSYVSVPARFYDNRSSGGPSMPNSSVTRPWIDAARAWNDMGGRVFDGGGRPLRANEAHGIHVTLGAKALERNAISLQVARLVEHRIGGKLGVGRSAPRRSAGDAGITKRIDRSCYVPFCDRSRRVVVDGWGVPTQDPIGSQNARRKRRLRLRVVSGSVSRFVASRMSSITLATRATSSAAPAIPMVHFAQTPLSTAPARTTKATTSPSNVAAHTRKPTVTTGHLLHRLPGVFGRCRDTLSQRRVPIGGQG